MATREEIQRALIAAHSSGDTAAAQTLAEQLRSMQGQSNPEPTQASQERWSQRVLSQAGIAPSRPRYGGPVEEAIGLGEAALTTGTAALGNVAGLAASIPYGLTPGGKTGMEAFEAVSQGLTYEPRTEVGQRTVEGIANAPVIRHIGQAMEFVGDPDGTGDPLAAEWIKSGIGAIPVLNLARRRTQARREAGAEEATGLKDDLSRSSRNAPSLDELRSIKDELYEMADNSGVVIDNNSYRAMLMRMRSRLRDEGFDQGVHEQLIPVWQRLVQDSGQPMSMRHTDTLRQIINDGGKSPDPRIGRMSGIMRQVYDDWLDDLGPDDVFGDDPRMAIDTYRAARSVVTRIKKGELIADVIQRARNNSDVNYTAAGFEQALRREFNSLRNKLLPTSPSRRNLPRFTREEMDAINRVADGTFTGNRMREIGRLFNSSGQMGPALTSLMGGGAGFAVGGPAGAAIGAGGAAALGKIGRAGATASTRRNARMADEIMRRGPVTAPNINEIANQVRPR